MNEGDTIPVIEKLTRDLRAKMVTISRDEARYLVTTYYQIQENRKREHNQLRRLCESGEPHEVLEWLAKQSETLELQIRAALDVYSLANPVGEWTRSILGIGPVLAAGLTAHIDIRKARTAGAIWRYAGLDPTVEWKKGEKRPWNADLKLLCWKIGDSFVKVSGNPKSFYGKVYRERKGFEVERNDAGVNREVAEARVETVGKTTEAYKWYSKGLLPPGRIDLRARRYAVKLFLSHFHEISYVKELGEKPPIPYPIAFGEHVHQIDPPTS